jgi:hypothetical protein
MWWLWIVVAAIALVLLGIALFRSRRGWGPRSGPYRDEQAVGKTMLWIARDERSTGDGGR